MQNFLRKTLNQFADDITDKVFLLIQNDQKLMTEYLMLISQDGSKSAARKINGEIGKAVKAAFKLGNCGKCNKPKSSLIQDEYTRHSVDESFLRGK